MTHVEVKKPAGTPQPMSPQTRQAIGIGAMVLCLLIGGGIVYWFLFGASPSRNEVDVDPNQRVRLQGRQMPAPRIQKTSDKLWTVNGDVGAMSAADTGHTYQLQFGYQRGQLGLNQQQINLISGRYRIISDAAMAKAWGITPEQLDKLKKLESGGGAGTLKPSDAERNELQKLWQEFQSASDKGAAQKKVVDKLDEVARANLPQSKKVLLDRIDQISQILTPDQVQKITK